MEPNTRTHVTRRRARRGWLGPLPIVAAVIAWILSLVAWRAFADPEAPSTFVKFDPNVERFADFEWSRTPLFTYGDLDPDGILIVGESRVPAAVSLRILRRHGVEPVGVLWAALAQTRDVVRGARELPPRKLLVCLSPVGLYSAEMPRMVQSLAIERERTFMQRVDQRLDDELDVLRQKLLRTTELSTWLRGPSATHREPRRQEGMYAGLVGESTRAKRDERLVELTAALGEMRDAGWQIACVRLPAERGVEQIEDQGFAPERFRDMCAGLGVPYLDMTGGDYATSDGSHLLGFEADRASAVIAAWLIGLGWTKSR